ncbi:MAG TPA: UDP-N-acetylmuramate--L-alanine ligase [Acidimicrobiales bacterium]|nr:UDP-N-acetylmuramate--L-alanine ligase [Acidimicrobiales bacterium]
MSPARQCDAAGSVPQVEDVDLSGSRRIHVVGVGGAGMSAIASVLAAMGHAVTGSDLKASPAGERLRAAGITVTVGHRPEAVGDAELVTVSTAVADDNPEIVEARRRHIPVLRRASVLRAIAATRRCVAVAGTHGKTTTTSMLSLVLVEAGLRPSFLVGGDVNEIGTNALWDDGEWLVLEADESDGTFLALDPEVAVVTNIEADHLDHYGEMTALESAFDRFATGRPGGLIVGADDARSAALGRRHGGVSVGTAPEATYRITDLAVRRDGVAFAIEHDGASLGRVTMPVPGVHNARNAAVAMVAALAAGASFDDGARAMARFAGVSRRFEWRGDVGGVRFVDDYAHLPTEVAVTVDAARAGDWGRVVAVFQPHRFSRTAALSGAFADAFVGADLVVITDVYPAGERPVPGVSGQLVADAVVAAHPGANVTYVAGRAELRAYLAEVLRSGDLCLTLGAGDITSLADELALDGVR